MSDNYYILLGLKPSVDDWPTIESAIQDRRRNWSRDKNQGSPTARREAEPLLALIPDMEAKLRDPETRQTIAREAEKELNEEKVQQMARLNGLIDMIRDATIDPDDVNLLVRQVGEGITEAEVVARLKTRGITVGPTASTQDAPKVRPKLDRTRANSIRDNLRRLNKGSLYDFLGIGHRSSPRLLFDTADEMLKELLRKGLRDPDSNNRQELAGQCKAVFKNSEQKERYDNTYAAEAMVEFDGRLEVASKLRDGFLELEDIDLLVREARTKGVGQDIALEYIEDYARKRKWNVQRTSELLSGDFKVCGFCDTLARTAKDSRCHNCGQELVQPCPRCSHPTPTQDECCSDCGCSTGDAPFLQGLLREGQEHVARADFAQARVCFDRALIYWKDWEPAVAGRRRADKLRDAWENALKSVDALARSRKLEEARSALDQVKRDYGPGGTDDLQRRIRDGIGQARIAFDEGDKRRAAGKTELAFEMFSKALSICADHRQAQEGLRSCPPLPPSAVKSSSEQSHIQLEWLESTSRGPVKYEVWRREQFPNSGQSVKIATISHTRYSDSNVPSGQLVTYSVASVRQGVPSATMSDSDPVFAVTEIREVTCVPGDRMVTLRWQFPENATEIEIWRAKGSSPSKPGDWKKIADCASDSYADSGLDNGVRLGYRVIARFPAPGGSTRSSAGVIVHATPNEPLKPVSDLRVVRNGDSFAAHWSKPSRGQVHVYLGSREPSIAEGSMLTAAQARQLGEPITNIDNSKASFRPTRKGAFFVVPVTVEPPHIILGKWLEGSLVDDVRNVQAFTNGQRLSLRWDWPDSINSVLVVSRTDQFPVGPNDSKAERLACTKAQYEQRHGLPMEAPDASNLYVSVYSSVIQSRRTSYSMGATKGYRRRVILRKSRVGYKIDRATGLRGLLASLLRTNRMKLLLVTDSEVSLPNLVLVGRADRGPLSLGDGEPSAEISEGTPCSAKHGLELELSNSSTAMHYRLFARNEADYEWFDIARI